MILPSGRFEMKNRFLSNDGQSLVEFALILVLLLAVVFGIIEFAMISYNKAMITHASREAARAGVMFRVDPGTFAYSPMNGGGIRTVVNNYLQDKLVTFGTPFNVNTDVTPTWSVDGGTTWTSVLPTTHGNGEQLRVEIRFSYSYLLLPKLLTFGGNTLDLKARSIMRLE